MKGWGNGLVYADGDLEVVAFQGRWIARVGRYRIGTLLSEKVRDGRYRSDPGVFARAKITERLEGISEHQRKLEDQLERLEQEALCLEAAVKEKP